MVGLLPKRKGDAASFASSEEKHDSADAYSCTHANHRGAKFKRVKREKKEKNKGGEVLGMKRAKQPPGTKTHTHARKHNE